MYGVALVVDPSVHVWRSWAFAIGVLCFSLLEIFVLSSLVSDLFDSENVTDIINDIAKQNDKNCGELGDLSNTERILIVFLSILWMLPLIQDIKKLARRKKL